MLGNHSNTASVLWTRSFTRGIGDDTVREGDATQQQGDLHVTATKRVVIIPTTGIGAKNGVVAHCNG